eukprot:SAG11_NODE_1352_length_5131_cov_19.593402_1_plen_440_part_00
MSASGLESWLQQADAHEGGATSNTAAAPRGGASSGGSREYVLNFASLPGIVFVVLLLDFFDKYRSFGLTSVQFLYMTNEFGMSDEETGYLQGLEGTVKVVFAILGSFVTDAIGVRRTALLALSVSLLSRGLITFIQNKSVLYFSYLLLTPFGDAILQAGLYTVGLKKLSPPSLRPLVFGVQYATFNFAGAAGDTLVGHLRSKPDRHFFGETWTGTRQFLLTTWLAILIAWVLAYKFLEDVTVVDPTDPEEAVEGGIAVTIPPDTLATYRAANPAARGATGKMVASAGGGRNLLSRWREWRKEATRRYVQLPTPMRTDGALTKVQARARENGWAEAVRWLVSVFCADLAVVGRLRALWRVLLFNFAVSWVALQWTFSASVMGVFIERNFGEQAPIYLIHSINLWGCLLFPPLVAALVSNFRSCSSVPAGPQHAQSVSPPS